MNKTWLLLALSGAVFARAELTLSPVFSDHMVLQRDVPLPVWGRAEPGAAVAGEFAGDRRRATADAAGRWRLEFAPCPASAQPKAMRISCAGAACEIEDVLVGEVWLCAGQSNMEWPLAREARAGEEIPRAVLPTVRLLNPDYPGKDRGGNAFTPAEVQQLVPERYFRGRWTVCTSETAGRCSAIGYYFAKEIAVSLGVPVGVIHLAVGGSPAESWMRPETLAADSELRGLIGAPWLENPALEAWCQQRAHENLDRALGAGEVDARNPPHAFLPGFLWKAAIEPLAPFALRGILWYQGESNALRLDRVRQHERMFPLLVRDLRSRWGAGDLPFLFCQLSGIETAHYHSEFWPEFRDSQRRLAAVVPNSGMVVTCDVGDPANVHPKDNRTVATRLARLALAQVYGWSLLAHGPRPQVGRVKGHEVEVTFDSVGAGLALNGGGELLGFEIAAKDGDFFPARGRLGHASVVLASDRVTAPRRVRYNWQPFPRGDLVNDARLPASTFEMEAER